MPKDRYIKCRKQVAGELGVGHATTYRMQNRGELPPPVRISKGRVGWWSDEFEEFKRSLPTAGGERPKKKDKPPSTEKPEDGKSKGKKAEERENETSDGK